MVVNFFANEILKVGALFLIASILAIVILLLALTLGAYNPDPEKTSAYECGFDPYEDSRNMFDVKFYLVSILFIIFDLEALYFFPFCASFSCLTLDGFFSMIDFIVELFVGYIFVSKMGALEWN